MKKKILLLLLLGCFSSSFIVAQTKTISGKITDEEGITLPGASVEVKGMAKGTVTDFDGLYTIDVNPNDILVFSYLGYETQKVEVGNQDTIDIQLILSKESLDEVVVTAFGIKKQKAAIGVATQNIKSEKLNEGGQTDISNALKGKVSGVKITSASSDPGASSGIVIRGATSLTQSNQALIIVDGVPINNESIFIDDLDGGFDAGRGIDDLNPEDIESVNIIKGLSAAAIYGNRAANGAVIITTKKGKSGKVTVDVSSQYIATDVLRVPRYQSDFGQGWDGQSGGVYLQENGSWGARFNGQTRVWGSVVENSQQIKPFLFQNDQLENFFETGSTWINNVAISGGQKGTTGRISFSNRTIDGIYPEDIDENIRNTANMSFTSDQKWIKFSGSATYVDTKGSSVPTGQGLTTYNNIQQIPNDLDITSFSDLNNQFNSLGNYFTPFAVTNPYWSLQNAGSTLDQQRIFGSFETVLKLYQGLNLTYRIGVDNTEKRVEIFESAIDLPSSSPNAGINQAGSFAEGQFNNQQINHNLILGFNGKFNDNFSVSTNAGIEYNKRTADVTTASVASQDLPGFFDISNSSGSVTLGTNSIIGDGLDIDFFINGKSERRTIGVFNTTTFNFKDEVYLTGSIRSDWSSTIPEKNRPEIYGGISTSWVFTKSLDIDPNVFNSGKLRISYSETGVDAPAYKVFADNVIGQTDNQAFRNLNFPLNGVSAFEVDNRLANPDLTSEVRKEFEVGAELAFLRNRLTLDTSIYFATGNDLITKLNTAPSIGFTNQIANLIDTKTIGYETLLNVDWIRNPDGFNWSSNFNYTQIDFVVDKINADVDQIDLGGLSSPSLIAREGESILIQGNVPSRSPSGQIVVDGNGVPIVSPAQGILGDTEVDFTWGVTNTFKYKGIKFQFTLDGSEGGVMFSRTADINRFTGNSIVTTFNDRKPFIVPNSVQNTGTPENPIYVENTTAVDREHQDDYYRADATDGENIIDKTFVKLREVVLGYSFNKGLLTKLKLPINKLSFNVIGRNLLLWTPEENQFVDPETSTFGTDLEGLFGEFSSNPSTRSVSFQLKAQF